MDEGKMGQFKIQVERLRNFIITKMYWVGVTRSQMKTIRNQGKFHLLEGNIHRVREIIQVVHVSGSQGHCGVEATMKRIAQDYSWRSIKADVRKYIRACVTCQNYEKVKTQAPLTIPIKMSQPLVDMDLIVKLEEKPPKNQDEESGGGLTRTGPRSPWTGAEVHGVQQYFILDPTGLRIMTDSSIGSFLIQQPVVQRVPVAGQNYLLRNRKIDQT